MINRLSGEINRFRDDGTNYIQDLLVVPPKVAEEMLANQRQDFGRQG